MLRRYALITLAITTIVTIAFLIVEALNIDLLVDPTDQMDGGGTAAAALGVGLLLVDVLIPVPSSIVMTLQGELFGFVGGSILGWIGSCGATLVGFWLGRRGSKLIQGNTDSASRERANRLVERFGTLAIIITRPLPILAETTSIVAGSTAMTWRQVTVGAALGCLPAAVIYSAAGAFASSISSGIAVFPIVLFLAAIFWGIGWWLDTRIVGRMAENKQAPLADSK